MFQESISLLYNRHVNLEVKNSTSSTKSVTLIKVCIYLSPLIQAGCDIKLIFK